MFYKSQTSRWPSWSPGDNTCLTHVKDLRFQTNANNVTASEVEVAVIRRRCTLQHATPRFNRVAAPDSAQAGGRQKGPDHPDRTAEHLLLVEHVLVSQHGKMEGTEVRTVNSSWTTL